jgi:rubrerythrin
MTRDPITGVYLIETVEDMVECFGNPLPESECRLQEKSIYKPVSEYKGSTGFWMCNKCGYLNDNPVSCNNCGWPK